MNPLSPHVPATPQFEVYFDLLKSERGSDGRVYVSGIASDQSEDLDGEIVKAAAYPQSIEYLKRFGKFNFDHRAGIIGDITHADFISPQGAREKYGVKVLGKAVEISGWVAPLESAPYDKDLQELHKLVGSKSKLGFSMQGLYKERKKVELPDGRSVTVAVPGFVPQVAITPQPKNSNAVCFVKSLAGVLSPDCEEMTHGEDARWPLVICPSLETLSKGLECTGAIAVAGMTGGDSLKVEDLIGPGREKKKRKKEENEDEDEKEAETLRRVGIRKAATELVEAARLLVLSGGDELEKSFQNRKRIGGVGSSHKGSHWESEDGGAKALRLFRRYLEGKTFTHAATGYSWTPGKRDLMRLVVRGDSKKQSGKDRERFFDALDQGTLTSSAVYRFDAQAVDAIRHLPTLFEHPLFVLRRKENGKICLLRKIGGQHPFFAGVEIEKGKGPLQVSSFYVRKNLPAQFLSEYDVLWRR